MTTTTQPLPAGPAVPVRAAIAPRRRRTSRWIAMALALLVGAFSLWRYAGARSAPQVQYQTAAVDRGPISAKVSATGTLSALVTVIVGSQVSGRIATLAADFNSQVKKGEVIATIDPSLFRAAVEQARANYLAAASNVDKAIAQRAVADKQFERAKALLADNLIARADYDTAEANAQVASTQVTAARAAVAQTRAALDQAELNLRYTTIVSPIDGVVVSRNVDVGQTVAATFQSPTLFTIAQDLTKMQVDTSVAEADVGKVREGMRVTFTVDAYPGKTFPGVVRQVRDNAQTVQNVVTYDAVIDVDNSDHLLKPGMTASVTFVYADKDDVVRLPNAALRFTPDRAALAAMTNARKSNGAEAPRPPDAKQAARSDQRRVWILRGGQAMEVVVRIGISDGVMTEVVDGDVRPGDLAITEAVAAGKGG